MKKVKKKKAGRPKGSKNSYRVFRSFDKSGIKPYKRLWHTYGYQEKKMDLTIFIKMVKMNCYYCNSKPQLVNPYGAIYKEFDNRGRFIQYDYWNSGWVLYNGIDKKEHKDSYEDISNLVTCCKICNFMKQRLTHDEFINQIKK